MLWAREFIVGKVSMRVRVWVRSSDERAWESVKQDYKRDRLVGWPTLENMHDLLAGIYFIFNYVYVHNSPYLLVCGDDQVTCYPRADNVSGEPGDA